MGMEPYHEQSSMRLISSHRKRRRDKPEICATWSHYFVIVVRKHSTIVASPLDKLTDSKDEGAAGPFPSFCASA